MPACPSCGSAVKTATRVFTVIVEPKEGERGLTQRKVGMYQCAKCGTKFPTVVGRQHYLVIADDQLAKIKADLQSVKKANEDLEKRIQAMAEEHEALRASVEKSRKDAETRLLQTKAEDLEKYVAYLRKEKGELEAKTAGFR